MLRKRDIGQTLVGTGTVIEGSLRVEGSIHIDGRVEGTVSAKESISVGPNGTITGEVSSESDVTVGGRVDGNVVVHGLLRVRSGGVIRGEISYESLEVEKGGSIEGQSAHLGTEREQRSKSRTNPTSLSPSMMAGQA